ncbi:AI-2E family transporter [Halioxenophilus aromaticivorans]|uniref:AI-2E family transporter n=1 Tax=Halioxenophilus aromaticivorans TaxID=1306992 RepID=UPI0031E9816E
MFQSSDGQIDQKKLFLWILLFATAAFGWILLPFAGPLLWSCVLAVLFSPVNYWLLRRFPNSPNLAALATLILSILVVVIPVIMITTSVVNHAVSLVQSMENNEGGFGVYIDKITEAVPIVSSKLESWNIDIETLRGEAQKFVTNAANVVTKRSLTIGQNTMAFFLATAMMLYVAFFMLRDGKQMIESFKATFPLDDAHETQLFTKFSEVIRATVKGNVVIGVVQGTLGGIAFWVIGIDAALLWGTMMAIAALIPAVGAALIWAPVAIYLCVVGDLTAGIGLALFGGVVIGLMDNILRPILVGRDTKLPDYIVLLSTLGGLALFGIHGFVVGPLIAALFFTLWSMFVSEFSDTPTVHEVEDTETESQETTTKNSSD